MRKFLQKDKNLRHISSEKGAAASSGDKSTLASRNKVRPAAGRGAPGAPQRKMTPSSRGFAGAGSGGPRSKVLTARGKNAPVSTSATPSISEANRRWKRIQMWLPQIIEYGRQEGILPPLADAANKITSEQADEVMNEEIEFKKNEDLIKIISEDVSLAHSAIPFLPLPVAIGCFVMNVVIPGSGTFLSGIMVCFVGQSRMLPNEGRMIFNFVINLLVSIAQLCTITFFLVGWFWSIAWGGLMIMHSLEFRNALIRHRQEAVTAVALEALTKDSLLNRRQVQNLVTEGYKK